MSTKLASKFHPMRGQAAPCVPGALPGGLVRTRFFDGMVLSQADLETEQRFWRMKRMLTNRALGDGVVWGLRLDWDADTGVFSLGPGYALDCCGNDLIVECATAISAYSLIERSDPAVKAWCAGYPGREALAAPCPDPVQGFEPRKACVVLQYVECPDAPRPVHIDGCEPAPSPAGCEPSRVRETARLLLVPPPEPLAPGPIGALCADLARERANAPAAAEPANEAEVPDIDVGVEVTGGYDRIQLYPGRNESGSLARAVETRLVTEPIRLQFSILLGDDFPFWLGESGQVTDGSGSVVAEMDRPGERLEWTAEFSIQNLSPDAVRNVAFSFTVRDLTVASLLGDEDAVFAGRRQTMTLRVQGSIAIELLEDRGQEVEIAYEVPRVTVEVEAFDESALAPRACLDPVSEHALIFAGDPECTAKALIMTLLHGWLGSVAGDGVRPAERALAEEIYREAWRALFRGTDDPAALRAFVTRMDQLFAALCRGLLYPGPRCRDDHHGVYLGCVELSRTGRIVRFDPWEHRRNVLTGPLLAHWGHQLGFAPLEEILARTASAICCLSGRTVLQGPVVERQPGERRVPIGEAVLIYGEPTRPGRPAQPALTEAERARVVSSETVAWPAMISSVAEVMMRRREPSGGARTAHRLISHPASGLHLLVPAAEPAARPGEVPGAAGGAVAALVDPVVRELGPLARAPVRDLAAGVADAAPVSELAALRKDAEPARAITAALREARVASVSGMLELGAEAVFENVRNSDSDVDPSALAKAVDAAFLDAEKLVVTAAEAATKAARPARNRPAMVRERAGDDRLVSAVTDAIDKAKILARPLRADAIKAIADRVAGARPAREA